MEKYFAVNNENGLITLNRDIKEFVGEKLTVSCQNSQYNFEINGFCSFVLKLLMKVIHHNQLKLTLLSILNLMNQKLFLNQKELIFHQIRKMVQYNSHSEITRIHI